MKAHLTLQIYLIIRDRGLTQAQAAQSPGIKQPHVSLLMRNHAGTFSVGRLMDFLTALGQDIELTIRPSRKPQGEILVKTKTRSFEKPALKWKKARSLSVRPH
jgi:predicted XRE-type DNA-binding protein